MKKTLRITGIVIMLIAAYYFAAGITGIMNELNEQQLCTVIDYSGIAILMAVLFLIVFAVVLFFSKDKY